MRRVSSSALSHAPRDATMVDAVRRRCRQPPGACAYPHGIRSRGTHAARNEESRSAHQALRGLWPSIHLAEEMVARLGPGEILLQAMCPREADLGASTHRPDTTRARLRKRSSHSEPSTPPITLRFHDLTAPKVDDDRPKREFRRAGGQFDPHANESYVIELVGANSSNS